jgi:hypothetical protein
MNDERGTMNSFSGSSVILQCFLSSASPRLGGEIKILTSALR